MNFALAMAAGVTVATSAAMWRREKKLRLRAEKLRGDERQGRIRAEKKLADLLKHEQTTAETATAQTESAAGRAYDFQCVGHVATCFAGRNGTPRQSFVGGGGRSILQLEKHIDGAILRGLAEYSHVYVLFVFSENTNMHKGGSPRATPKAVVKPPRLNGRSIGVFACRTPHRPAPIGLSLARVVSVSEKDRLVVLEGLDLVDGTPVLDIKPCVPQDSPADGELRVPDWVAAQEAPFDVTITEKVQTFLDEFFGDEKCKHLKGDCSNARAVLREHGKKNSRTSLCFGSADCQAFIRGVLDHEIRSVFQRTTMGDKVSRHSVELDVFALEFEIDPVARKVTVDTIAIH